MTSKKGSKFYYIFPVNGKALDKNFLQNGHDTSKVYTLIPIMELCTNGEYQIGCIINTIDGVLNNYSAQVETDIKYRMAVVFDELREKTMYAEFAVFCDVNPIQFVCSHKCQKQAIIKAFSGYEGFDAEKSFINH